MKTDRSLLELIVRHVGAIHVPTPVLTEAKQFTTDEAQRLGLTLVEPELSMALVAASALGALSFEDRLCLLLAKERGWTCVTNDRKLRNECEKEGIDVLWGLQLIMSLLGAKAIGPDEAVHAARAISATNPRFGKDVLVRFEQQARRQR